MTVHGEELILADPDPDRETWCYPEDGEPPAEFADLWEEAREFIDGQVCDWCGELTGGPGHDDCHDDD